MVLLVTLKVRLHIATILLGILYRPPDKLDFVKHINNDFTETGVLDKQERFLLRTLNINLLLAEK